MKKSPNYRGSKKGGKSQNRFIQIGTPKTLTDVGRCLAILQRTYDKGTLRGHSAP